MAQAASIYVTFIRDVGMMARGEDGVRGISAGMTVSFLALEVIPSLKLTDKGLVDVDRFEIVGLWADRTDIGDSVEFARQLREKAQRRG